MPTLDELLNASNEVATCTVNPDTREIIVPEKYKILGVFSDEKVTKIPFTCPKVVGNNVDLTEYKLYINYQNAIGRHNAYLVDDVEVSGDNITFSWLLSRDVTLSSGVVKYSLCAKKLNGDLISNEWNTTIANGLVIQGLEATQAIIAEKSDIIEAILSKAHTHANKSILDKFAETDGKPTYDGKTFLQSVSTDDIDERAVTNAKISNGAISTGKIANNAVTEDKLSTEFVAKVDGKQDKITSTNKLEYSLISGTPTIPTVPTALPNPNALTFTGAVTGSYDGSEPLSVEIPSGGEEQWELNATYQYSDLQFPASFDLSGAKEWIVVLRGFYADVETKIDIKFGLSPTYSNMSYFNFFVGTHAWGNAGIIHYCERPVVGIIVDANFGFNVDGSSELHRMNCPTGRKMLNMDAPKPTATLKGGKILLYRRTK